MKHQMAPTGLGIIQRTINCSSPGAVSPLPLSNGTGGVLRGPENQKDCITTALIDGHGMSRDCMICAIHTMGSRINVIPFSSIFECINSPMNDLDVIVYYCHDDDALDHLTGQEVTTLRQAFSDIPIIVLSDAKRASQAKVARAVIRSGARGFIPTRTIEIQSVSSAIRYVAEGGTVVPVDILFSDKAEYEEPLDQELIAAGLTSRQNSVLAHLRQGKPNKIIAHDLRMSESTVKVHIRNIMRKMGATNRTQAVYKARQLYDAQEADRLNS